MQNPIITFNEVGSYLVTLTVNDGTVSSETVSQTITVEDDNTGTITL